jgi:hypothetical protein
MGTVAVFFSTTIRGKLLDSDNLKCTPFILRSKIEYFFERYKDLEPKTWSKVLGWDSRVTAEKIIIESIERKKKDSKIVSKNKK